MPYKVWGVGEEVLQEDFQPYVQEQVVATFPTAAARAAAILAPKVGQCCHVTGSGLQTWDGTAWRSNPPAGSLMPFAGTAAPTGWLIANGQLVNRVTYADLFAAIGAAWGAGDGSTTFAVPNMTGRAPAGVDAAGTVLGGFTAVGTLIGNNTKTLALAELPANMSLTTYAAGATHNTNGRVSGQGTGGAGVASNNTTIGLGNGTAFSLVQPTAAVTYIIKV